MTSENLIRRPAAGLSVLDRAILGSPSATQQVLEVVPELGQRPPAGLSTMEWAQIGSESATEKVKVLLLNNP